MLIIEQHYICPRTNYPSFLSLYCPECYKELDTEDEDEMVLYYEKQDIYSIFATNGDRYVLISHCDICDHSWIEKTKIEHLEMEYQKGPPTNLETYWIHDFKDYRAYESYIDRNYSHQLFKKTFQELKDLAKSITGNEIHYHLLNSWNQ